MEMIEAVCSPSDCLLEVVDPIPQNVLRALPA